MPITPRFKISQTETQIIVTIHIPHIRVSASTLDMLVDGNDFHFHSAPYLLYLNFPGRLLDDAETIREAKAAYDPSNQNGVITVTIFKEDEGIWKDLDLLGNLVNRSASTPNGVPPREKIQVIASDNENGNETVSSSVAIPDDDSVDDFPEDIKSCLRPHYGFLNLHHSVFTAYAREGLSHDMLEIPSPDETPAEDRRELRLKTEVTKFDADRYLGDLFLSSDPDDENADMVFTEAMRMEAHWETDYSVDYLAKEMEKLQTEDERAETTGQISPDFFDNDEMHRLVENKAKIPPQSKISAIQKESIFLSLVDILYAYAYDHRTTLGDATCESSWTIVMLSPTLSWFESYTPPYDSIASVLRWSIRRALIHPYLRNYNFVASKLVKDVASILAAGKRVVLRCLLQIQKTLEGSEFHYLFNKLYISPYISWIQMIDDEDLASFASQVNECVLDGNCILSKSSLGLDLVTLEKDAFDQDEEENESESDTSGSESESDDSSSGDDSSGEDNEKKDTNVDNIDSVSDKPRVNLLDDQIGNGNLLSIARETTITTGDKAKVEPRLNKSGATTSLITEL